MGALFIGSGCLNIETYEKIKRFLDIVFSIIVLVVLIVPFLIIAVIIIIDNPGASPLYVQRRVGKNGKEFNLYKFRSMIPDAENMLGALLNDNEMDGPAFKIENDPRITRFGRFIRKSGIDEFPQLINVIKGDMSVVGPRPPLAREVEQYGEKEKIRLSITPGITCYWQIQPKRNSLTFEQWLELDIKYINERSLKTDSCILFKTVRAVFGMEGV